METVRQIDNFDTVVAASLSEVDAHGDEIINGEYSLPRDPSSELVRTLGQLGSTEVTLGPVPDEPRKPLTPPKPPEQPKPEPEPMP
jgi:hypothetical protein